MTDPSGVAVVIPDRRKVLGGPNTHRTLIIVGWTLQAISIVSAHWVADYRAALVFLGGALLQLAKTSTAIGRREED